MAGRCSERQVLEELQRLLSSREFSSADRAARFLKYVVEHSLAGDREGLKESIIGTEVFDRPPGYDPKAEPIVRTEARRLRAKLDEFYSRSHDSVVRISVPKGAYVAVFETAESPTPAAAPENARRRPWSHALIAGVSVIAVGALTVSLVRRGGGSELPVLSTVTSFPGGQFFPSLSPGGAEVAFVWRGEDEAAGSVYTLNLNGGQPRRITSDPSDHSFPVWSPEGSRMAFIRSAKGIMIAGAQGGNERLVAKAFPATLSWSPDGKRILYCDWMEDGSRFALFSADSLTGERRRITDPPPGTTGDLHSDFSPDGKEVAFSRCHLGNCEVYTAPSEGGPVRLVAQAGANIAGLAWSPSGQTIVFASRRTGQYQLWKSAANGSGKPELVAIAGEDARFPRFDRGASGPDRLVYEQHINDSNIWRVKLDAAGSAGMPRRLIASTRLDSSPQISPDGRKIVFSSDRSGFDEIWTADVDGSNSTAVTRLRAQSLGSPRWSPDSRRIAFDVVSSEGRAIFIVDAAGGTPRQWSRWTAAGRPSWSRDGGWIYFGDANSSGGTQVFKISTDDPKQLVQVTNDGAFEAFESLDGKTLFYVHDHELRRMPAAGGKWSAVTDRRVAMGMWSVAEAGVYFVDMTSAHRTGEVERGQKPIYLLNPNNGSVRQVASISGDINDNLPDFCVSPDGKALYYSILEISVSQIRMIEGRF